MDIVYPIIGLSCLYEHNLGRVTIYNITTIGVHDIHCGPKSYKLSFLGNWLSNTVSDLGLEGGHVFKPYRMFISPLY